MCAGQDNFDKTPTDDTGIVWVFRGGPSWAGSLGPARLRPLPLCLHALPIRTPEAKTSAPPTITCRALIQKLMAKYL